MWIFAVFFFFFLMKSFCNMNVSRNKSGKTRIHVHLIFSSPMLNQMMNKTECQSKNVNSYIEIATFFFSLLYLFIYFFLFERVNEPCVCFGRVFFCCLAVDVVVVIHAIYILKFAWFSNVTQLSKCVKFVAHAWIF